jgi:ClpP class serine protease
MTSAEVIVHALVNHQGPISIYVPYTCMSAGTLIALTGTQIYMDPNAYCGTIDPQMMGVSVTSIIGYCEKYVEVTSFLGDLARLLLSQAHAAMTRVRGVLDQIPSIQDKREQIDLELVSGRHNHDKPLFVDEMRPLINVTVGIPPPVLALYQSFLGSRKPTSSLPFGLYKKITLRSYFFDDSAIKTYKY